MKSDSLTIVSNMDEMPAMITAADFQRLGISRTVAYQMMRRPDMPVVKIGRRMFVPKDKFLLWLDKSCKVMEVQP